MHIALTPAFMTGWALQDAFEAMDGAPEFNPNRPRRSWPRVTKAKASLATLGDAELEREWRMTSKGATLFEWPKTALVRAYALNHLCHHRGQLSVYLRLLDVPVPSNDGPSGMRARCVRLPALKEFRSSP